MHFVIVSYTFPPSKEIGGRRWAKFSQHLSRLGHEVTVVCTKQGVNKDWYKQEFPGVEFKLLPNRYPGWLSGFTESFIEKFYYFFSIRLLSPLTKQNLFDCGFAWKKTMLSELESVHTKNKIDVLVVTGAPYSLLYYGAQFKRRHKDVFYVSDLRDPWTWGSYYGIPNLSPSKKKFQELSESETIEQTDMFSYSSGSIGDVLRKKYPAFSSKLYLLPHAYDPEKFPPAMKEEKRKGFIYGGTLYDGIEEYMKRISEIVKSNSDSGFKWDIYTGTNYPLIDSNFANGSIRKHAFVPEEELFLRMKKAAAYLAIFPRADKDLISTKFFEIVYTGTPILYIGEEGEVGKFIRENKLGVHILPENITSEFPKYLNGNVPFEPGYFDVTQYSFSTVTKNFISELNERGA